MTPLEVEMRYNMRENHQVAQQRARRATLEPVIDQNRGTTERDAINIQKNCGPDNVCIPDLQLNVKSLDQYLLGSKDVLVFEVDVLNHGEDAFEAGFFMTVPAGINFRKIERIGDSRDTPILCTPPSASTNQTLKCDIGNPLSSGKTAKFKVILLPATKYGIAPKYDFYMEANSTNAEMEGTGFDNIYKKTVDISVETNLVVKGGSTSEEILFNATDYVGVENATKEAEIGPQIVHIYEIRNDGPSTIESAEFYFLWPYETISHDPLLYLLNQPETTSNVRCEATSYANIRNLELDRTLAAKSYLETQGAVERSSLHSDKNLFASTTSSTNVGYGVGGEKTQITEEQKRRFDEEEARESSGDASYIHSQRANQVNDQHGAELQQTSSSAWNSIGDADRQSVHDTSSYTHSQRAKQVNDGRGQQADSEEARRSVTRDQSHSRSRGADEQQQIRDHEVHRAGFSSNGNVQRVEDFHSEGTVNQDISSQRANAQSSQNSNASSGRRRMMTQQDGDASRPGLFASVSSQDKNAFHSGVLELNTLNSRDNADDEIRRRGNAAHAAVTSGQQNQSGGGSSSSYQQSSVRNGGQMGQAIQGQSAYSSQSSQSATGQSGHSSQSSSSGHGGHSEHQYNSGIQGEFEIILPIFWFYSSLISDFIYKFR